MFTRHDAQTINDDNAHDAQQYDEILILLMRELIARVDAMKQRDKNAQSIVALTSIRNACEKYVDEIIDLHA